MTGQDLTPVEQSGGRLLSVRTRRWPTPRLSAGIAPMWSLRP